MDIKIELNISEYKDLNSYCKLNKFEQNDIVKKSYLEGFRIEKYGLLHGSQNTVETIVEKEVIRYVEVPKEIEKEIIRIEYVEVEKPVEVIKEVIVEKIIEVPVEVIREVIIEKEGDKGLKSKLDAIQQTLMKLRTETLEKDRLISEYEKTIEEIQKFQENKKAVFLRGSNLDDKLYK